jgi:WD40 repeat protein
LRQQNPEVAKLTFSPDGKYLSNGSIIWELPSGREVARLPNINSGKNVAFSPDGKHIVTEDNENSFRVWDISKQLLETSTISADFAHNEYAFSKNGRYLVSAVRFHSLSVREMPGGKELATIPLTAGVTDLSISDDGNYVAMGATHFDSIDLKTAEHLPNTVDVWEVGSRRLILRNEVEEDSHATMISPDGHNLIVRVGDKKLRVIKVKKSIETSYIVPDGDSILCNTFSHNSKLVATGGRKSLSLWDLSGGQEIARFPTKSPVEEVTFSWNDKYLAVRYRNGDVGIWEVEKKHEAHLIRSGGSNVLNIEFSPDGRYLAVVRDEGLVHVWDFRSVVELAKIKSRNHELKKIGFTPDGDLCLAETGFLRVQKWHPNDLVAEACLRLTHNLSTEEWRQYLPDEPYHKTCEKLP